jgi:hypothetical protein
MRIFLLVVILLLLGCSVYQDNVIAKQRAEVRAVAETECGMKFPPLDKTATNMAKK